MKEMSIIVTAHSDREMDKLIADRKKQGYTLKKRGHQFTGWETRKYYAVMYKEEIENAGV